MSADASSIVGRLAPSPTGAQHLGNARTYLVAWLAARAAGGRVLLRIEDIDSPRVKPWAADQAVEDLRWLGLDWDEGPDIGGPCAPYVQSERIEHYAAALSRLIELGLAYPCTCTRSDIESAASAPHEAAMIDGPVYPGSCAGWRCGDPLPPESTYCWRFRTVDEEVEIEDQICGSVKLNPRRQLGDFPLTRKNGSAAYQLAVVVDDEAMGITQVVRGDDLVPSLFRQRPIIDALGYRRPQYFHVPLVLGADGRRLAKRHGDTRLSQYRQVGIAPEAIIGWAAHSIGLTDSPRPVAADRLIAAFDPNSLRRHPTIVDPSWPLTVN